MGAIAVHHVSVERPGNSVLRDVDLRVDRGERLGILGPSGAGKTSLLRVMAGLDQPAEGSVQLDGGPVDPRSGEVTMVFQGDSVYEHLDVSGNLAFPLATGGEDAERRIQEAARRFLLARVLDRSPGTLSAGQRRVVSAARALIRSDVSVVLLDDPLIGTDRHLRRRLLESVLSDRDLTVVFATREGEDVLRWADRVAVLTGGRLAQLGLPQQVFRWPASLAVAEAMGELNRIPAAVSPSDGCLEVAGSRIAAAHLPERVEDGSRVVMGLRPSELRPARAGTPFSQRLRGTVGRVEQAGPVQRVLFGLGDRPGTAFCALVEPRLPVAVGDRMDWSVEPEDVRLYAPVSGEAL